MCTCPPVYEDKERVFLMGYSWVWKDREGLATSFYLDLSCCGGDALSLSDSHFLCFHHLPHTCVHTAGIREGAHKLPKALGNLPQFDYLPDEWL